MERGSRSNTVIRKWGKGKRTNISGRRRRRLPIKLLHGTRDNVNGEWNYLFHNDNHGPYIRIRILEERAGQEEQKG